MREFLAFQEFVPQEQTDDNRCIWCKQDAPRNKAHIISRKLTISSHSTGVLKFCICKECNSKCGQIEQWILRCTPLAWIRSLCYANSNSNSEPNISVPLYFYAPSLKEWLVSSINSKHIESQIILSRDGSLKLFSQKCKNANELDATTICDFIAQGKFRSSILSNLPFDFSPRAMLENKQVLVIARTLDDHKSIIRHFEITQFNSTSRSLVHYGKVERYYAHFRWSRTEWLKFCTKISYETLCLFEGAQRCLSPEFEMVRKYVLQHISNNDRELLFHEHGPCSDTDVPTIVNADLTVGQNGPSLIPALLGNVDVGMHGVILYEIDGWICSSVAIAGFPPSTLILAGPNCHLADLYQLVYDDHSDKFHYLKLACDPSLPIIPFPLTGDLRKSIVRTYNLVMTQ